LTSFRAGIHFQKGDPVTTLEVAAQAAELAEATGEEDALARAWIAMDWARFMLTGSTEGQHGEATIEILQRLGLQDRVSDVMNNLGGYAYMEGRWEDAAEWYRRAQDAAAKAGNPLSVADRGANLAELYIGQGRLDEARPLIDDAERAFRAAGVTSALPFVRLQRGRLALAEGFAEEAASILASAAADAAAVGDDWTEGLALVERAEALVRMGDLVKAARLLDTLESGGGAADFEPAICRVAALLAAAAGDDASEQLSKALRAAEGAGDLLEEARILELLATNEAAAPKNGRLIELSKQLGRLTTES
jgi:tetratricopeptide (TPR) repeat protein